MKKDPQVRPQYYRAELADGYPVEVRDIQRAFDLGRNTSNVLKYLLRRKPGEPAVEALMKART
jgi:hypothetical protein